MHRSVSCPSFRMSARIYRRFAALLAAALMACEAGEDDEHERYRGRCEQIFACDCERYLHADLDACMNDEAARRAGWLAQFAAAGLTPDEACMDAAQAADPDVCLTPAAYWLAHPEEPSRCGACTFASGDRQVGETCLELDHEGHPSDCAPGLSCVTTGTSSGVCVDPCQPIAEGLPCGADRLPCAEGLYCGPQTLLCTRAAGPGESCADDLCVAGYNCDASERCVAKAGAGESCAERPCDFDAGLVCGAGDVCRPRPRLGEPCRDGQCADELVCHVASSLCGPPGEVGEVCTQDHHCAPGLFCDEVCTPGRGPGEPCSDGAAPCRVDLGCIDGVCGPGEGLACVSP